jgi:hypothetical protein
MCRTLIEKVTIVEIFSSMPARDWASITGEEPGFQARAFYYRAIHHGEEFGLGGRTMIIF